MCKTDGNMLFVLHRQLLNVSEIGKAVRNKKRVAVRVSEELSKTLKEQLIAERDKYLKENPCFTSIGANFVSPEVTIDELCSQAYTHFVLQPLFSRVFKKGAVATFQ